MKDFISKCNFRISKQIYLDGSKSISNRALIIAALAKGQTKFSNLPNSLDVLTCIKALKDLGCNITHDHKLQTLVVEGCNGSFNNNKAKIFCSDSGTLARFIIPMCAVQHGGEYYIYAKQRMIERPLTDQLKPLEKAGMQATYHSVKHSMPMTINSQSLKGGSVEVCGTKSSQFASGLLMAAPFMQKGLNLKSIVDHKQLFLDMTIKVMQEFGVSVKVDDIGNHSYRVQPCQYLSPSYNYVVEPDVSTASYFWALAAITNSVIKVMDINEKSKQGDLIFLDVLKKMGCRVNYYNDGIEVVGCDNLKGIKVNMRNFSDTFMTLAVIACFAKGDTYITGLGHTRRQESDRILAITQGLTKLGIYVEATQDSMLLSPSRSTLRSAEIDSFNDHRIAMSLALLGLRQDGIIINNAEAVAKTCPDYFNKMRALVN